MSYLNEYSESTKTVCLCTTVSIVLILVFIISPLSKFIIASNIGKIVCLGVLGYAVYINFTVTRNFTQYQNIEFTSGGWDTVKTNIVCSHIFTLFMVLLFLSVIKKF